MVFVYVCVHHLELPGFTILIRPGLSVILGLYYKYMRCAPVCVRVIVSFCSCFLDARLCICVFICVFRVFVCVSRLDPQRKREVFKVRTASLIILLVKL